MRKLRITNSPKIFNSGLSNMNIENETDIGNIVINMLKIIFRSSAEKTIMLLEFMVL